MGFLGLFLWNSNFCWYFWKLFRAKTTFQIALERTLKDLNIKFETSQSSKQRVRINNNDVTEEIRSQEITQVVSAVAAEKLVRESLTSQQKAMGKLGGLVAEGRDIGTAVFPDADLKIFLNASPSERAKRRASDLKNQGLPIPSLKELENQIQERDRMDSTRTISPLMKAEDAIELMTDGMSLEAVVQELITLFQSKVPDEVWPT